MTESRSVIFGVSGTVLQDQERQFFVDTAPWGFILFARNIENANQVQILCEDMRRAVGRPDAPIFIDQEGGRVQRICPPLAPIYPPAATIGSLFTNNAEAGRRAAWLNGRLHAFDLKALGVNANCLPVLDIVRPETSDVIGTRSFGSDPHLVAELGKEQANGLMAGGVLPVMKHMPGHGRATVDSHVDLPHVCADVNVLTNNDFQPFKDLANLPAAMTAHIVYEQIDASNPATTSPMVISEIIRGYIGFDGLLMSDDVSMCALTGSYGERAKSILTSGCDLILHCNGDMEQMVEVANNCPMLSGEACLRAERALSVTHHLPADDNEKALREEFESLTGALV